jgi:hypothetical protein
LNCAVGVSPGCSVGKADGAELLDEYREHRDPSWSLSSRRGCAGRAERIKADQIGWRWKRTRKLAGIGPEWRLHDLRHIADTVAGVLDGEARSDSIRARVVVTLPADVKPEATSVWLARSTIRRSTVKWDIGRFTIRGANSHIGICHVHSYARAS